MNEYKKRILEYKIVHGRTGISYVIDYVRNHEISISPDIYVYNIGDHIHANLFDEVKIKNNKINFVQVPRYIKWETKIQASVDHIKEHYNDIPKYVLYIDGFDVLILNDIDNPQEMLDYYNCKMLFNGEANYTHTGFPEPYDPPIGYYNPLYYEQQDLYAQLNFEKYGYPHRKGLNAGVFLGEKDTVLSVLEETLSYMMDDHEKGFPYGCKDDQCALRYMQNKRFGEISVDVFNKYFFHCTPLSIESGEEDPHHYMFYEKLEELYTEKMNNQ